MYDSTESFSSAESLRDSLYEIREHSSSVCSDVRSSENKRLRNADDFVSSSSSSSQQSAHETSLGSDSEQDTDYESSAPDWTCQEVLPSLSDGLTSILAHERHIYDNLLRINNFVQEITPLEEKPNHQPENDQTRETLNKDVDEVDNIVPQLTSKSSLSAIGPPQLVYVPPDTTCLRDTFVEEEKTLPTTQSECFGGARRKTMRKNEGWDVYNKCKEDDSQNLVPTQVILQPISES